VPRVLPLNDAYPFGVEHGLQEEVARIRDMEIEWDRSYTSTVRRGYLVDLFQRNGVFDAFKQRYWPEGNTPSGQTMALRYLRVKSDYEDFLAGNRDAVVEADEIAQEQEDREFAAERDLRDFLTQNLDRIEPGLRLYEGGVEFPVGNGRIDIVALDRNDRFVILELKVSRGRERTLGQILYYMAWVDEHLGKGPSRGFIVAKEITDDLALAVRRVEGVSLFRYRMSFSVERVQ
jgi:hypothetical protein